MTALVDFYEAIGFKFNPHHDARGRFAKTGGIGGGEFGIEEAKSWGDNHYASWRGNLSSGEATALMEYRGSEYAHINEYLRTEGGTLSSESDRVGKIDSAFRKAPVLDRDVAVYRGMSSIEGLKPGMTISDKGYVSTTFHEMAAERFSRSKKKGIVAEIKVKKGKKALYLDKIEVGEPSWGELELLLPRGSSFRVLSTSPMTLVME